eukprot:9503795-Pyramimonas_sp.AAC.3
MSVSSPFGERTCHAGWAMYPPGLPACLGGTHLARKHGAMERSVAAGLAFSMLPPAQGRGGSPAPTPASEQARTSVKRIKNTFQLSSSDCLAQA